MRVWTVNVPSKTIFPNSSIIYHRHRYFRKKQEDFYSGLKEMKVRKCIGTDPVSAIHFWCTILENKILATFADNIVILTVAVEELQEATTKSIIIQRDSG